MADGIDHHALHKELLKGYLPDFLELFAPDLLGLGTLRRVSPVDTEFLPGLPGHGHRFSDLILRLEFAEKALPAWLVHIEIQAQPDPTMAWRMYCYFSRAHETYRAPVYPITLLTYRRPARLEPSRYTLLGPGAAPIVDFRFHAVVLNMLNWREYAGRENPVAVALAAEMPVRREEMPLVKAICLRTIGSMELDPGEKAFLAAFVDVYLPLDGDQERVYNEIVEGWPMAEREKVLEITTSWERKGREEGRKEGQVKLLLLLLERRFGSVPAADARRLRGASLQAIDELALAYAEADTYEAFQAKLRELT